MQDALSTSQSHERAGRDLAAIILAAGKGTRVGSDLPKVALPVAGRAMAAWVVDAVRDVGAAPIVLVVGHAQEKVRAIFETDGDVRFAAQTEQLGTAHAVECTRPVLETFTGDVIVLAGDGPLIRSPTVRILVERHRATGASVTMATSVIDDPTGYGRIVRDTEGRFEAIVEHRNATSEQRRIREVNPSYYCFDSAALFDVLSRIERDPVSGEFYLTDAPALLKESGRKVEVIDAVPPEDVLSINTLEQLAEVEAILNARKRRVEVTR